MLHDGPGDASQQRAGKSSVTTRPDDDQIRVTIVRQADDLVGGVALQDLAVGRDSCRGCPLDRLADRLAGTPQVVAQLAIVERMPEDRRSRLANADEGQRCIEVAGECDRLVDGCLTAFGTIDRNDERVHAMFLRSHALIVALSVGGSIRGATEALCG